MTIKSLRVGIVGCGLIGGKRADAAAPHSISIVADTDLGRAEAIARKTNARATSDWREVVDGDVDLVIVATTHNSLSEIATAALEKGRHVLIEKPGGKSAADLHAVADLAESKNLIAKVGFNHRFHPALMKAKALLTEAELGPVMFIRGAYGHGGRPGYQNEWRMKKALSGGGQLIDQGAHLIDLSRWFMGDFVKAHGVNRNFFWTADVEDNAFVSLEGADGGVAWLHAGWTEWKNRFSFEIMARHGKMEISGLGGSYGTEKLTLYKMLPEMGPPETTSWEYPFPDRSWHEEMANVADAISGKATANGTARDAARMLEIVESIYGTDAHG